MWAVGRSREAYVLIKEAFERDEISKENWVFLAFSYLYIGEQEKALETIKTALSIFPTDWLVQKHSLGILVLSARYEDAIELFGKNYTSKDLHDLSSEILAQAGIAYFKTGNKSKATAILNELLSRTDNSGLNNDNTNITQIYVAMEEKDKALQFLEKAYVHRELDMVLLKTKPSFQPLHGVPRFEELLVKIGFK